MKSIIMVLVMAFALRSYFAWEQAEADSPLPTQPATLHIYSTLAPESLKPVLDSFAEKTGIQVTVTYDKPAQLMTRIQTEKGENAADLFISDSVTDLLYAKELGLLQPTTSETLNQNVPAFYYDNDATWHGFSRQARLIFYAKNRIDPEIISTYEALPEVSGKILIGSSSHNFNQAWLASLMHHHGVDTIDGWVKKFVAVRAPNRKRYDIDQFYDLIEGKGDIVIANSSVYEQLYASDSLKDREIVAQVGVVFPNQEGRGIHMNITGGGITHNAPNRDQALQLLEHLCSPTIQMDYAIHNLTYRLVNTKKIDGRSISLDNVKTDDIPLTALSLYRKDVLRITDTHRWR